MEEKEKFTVGSSKLKEAQVFKRDSFSTRGLSDARSVESELELACIAKPKEIFWVYEFMEESLV